MKYIVYAINLPTLSRALRYIDTQWGKENTVLFYANLVSPLPKDIAKEYNVIAIDSRGRGRTNGIKAIYADYLSVRESWRKLQQVLKNTDSHFTFVVFRDNEALEASLIEKVFRHYPHSAHLWIIEEGSGLYNKERAPISAVPLKKVFYRLAGISPYALKSVPQGMHPQVEKVICQHPEWVAEKFAGRTVEKQLDIFVPEFNKRFVRYITGANMQDDTVFDYVFLTTPLRDSVIVDDAFLEKYARFLRDLISVVTEHGKLLIKIHPRDGYDYSAYVVNDRIKVCTPLENQVPFECLHEYFGLPRIISLGSSVSLTASAQNPTILVNRLLGFDVPLEKLFNEHASQLPVVCHTIDDLKQVVNPNK